MGCASSFKSFNCSEKKKNSGHVPEHKCLLFLSAHIDNGQRVKERGEQRFPVPGEPVCVVCGRYGEYICNEVRVLQRFELFPSVKPSCLNTALLILFLCDTDW